MNLHFEYSDLVSQKNYEPLFHFYLELTLKTLKVTCEDLFLSLSIIDDTLMKTLNLSYRKVDRSTDVLSFAFLEGENLHYQDKMLDLGEIYISLAKCEEQAPMYNLTLEEELAYLFIHGLLHLLGYDHDTEEKKQTMFALQDEIFKKGKDYGLPKID